MLTQPMLEVREYFHGVKFIVLITFFKAQSFNAGGPGGFGASGSSANAATQDFSGN